MNLEEQLQAAARLAWMRTLQDSIDQDIEVDFSNIEIATNYLISERQSRAKFGTTRKAKILKLYDCHLCTFKALSWTRAKGDIFVCSNPINADEDGYMREIPDPNVIPEWCKLEDVKK